MTTIKKAKLSGVPLCKGGLPGAVALKVSLASLPGHNNLGGTPSQILRGIKH